MQTRVCFMLFLCSRRLMEIFMEENIKNENKTNQQHITWKVLGIFALVAILICSSFFIFNYNSVYDNDANGGWLPPSFVFIVWQYLLAVIFIIAAIVLKLIFKKRVRVWILLLASVIIPIICYNFNYHAFGEDGFLYPLVDEGGVFHSIVIGDYNFDGINDDEYHILYEERTVSSRYGGHFDDTIINYIDTNATGTGGGLSGCHCFYDWEKQVIELFLNEDSVVLKQVEILVAFQDASMAQNVSFYLDDSKLKHTLKGNYTVSIIFDADTCLKLQKRLGGEERFIPIKYVVEE